jgi:hypothetical protein
VTAYASPADLDEYLDDLDPTRTIPRPGAGSLGDPDDADAYAERVLDRAEHDVDRVVGPWPLQPHGRKFDPEALTLPQQTALRNATCCAASFRLAIEELALLGEEEHIPSAVTIDPRRAFVRDSPAVIEILAGTGLLRRSGCAAPDPYPDPVLPTAA